MGYAMGVSPAATFFAGLLSLALTVWFVFFSVQVLQKLDKLIEISSNK